MYAILPVLGFILQNKRLQGAYCKLKKAIKGQANKPGSLIILVSPRGPIPCRRRERQMIII
jgi:hypothetical protein